MPTAQVVCFMYKDNGFIKLLLDPECTTRSTSFTYDLCICYAVETALWKFFSELLSSGLSFEDKIVMFRCNCKLSKNLFYFPSDIKCWLPGNDFILPFSLSPSPRSPRSISSCCGTVMKSKFFNKVFEPFLISARRRSLFRAKMCGWWPERLSCLNPAGA